MISKRVCGTVGKYLHSMQLRQAAQWTTERSAGRMRAMTGDPSHPILLQCTRRRQYCNILYLLLHHERGNLLAMFTGVYSIVLNDSNSVENAAQCRARWSKFKDFSKNSFRVDLNDLPRAVLPSSCSAAKFSQESREVTPQHPALNRHRRQDSAFPRRVIRDSQSEGRGDVVDTSGALCDRNL